MRTVNSTVDTVNAAASAIVTAEARVQPTATVPKRRWGKFWSMYWCFGFHKNSKRIGHAVLGPEPAVSSSAAPAASTSASSMAIVLPFIAPPSSPASFLQSDPPSVTQSPAGLLSLASLSANAYSPRGPPPMFTVGPYAYETQLVSPPVFSTFTTEPSTAPLTPPPESVHMTTPSSPEVPFAQLLTSSLERSQRNGGTHHKFGPSQYEFHAHHLYPASPGGQLISPGSVVSNSGTSSPFPGKLPIIDLRVGEAPKLLGFEHFYSRKWGSRLGSGSLTPDGGVRSRLGSGSVTPDGMGLGSRLSSGCLTPDGVAAPSRDSYLPVGNQTDNMASIATSDEKSRHEESMMAHRVSFELTGEDVARCLVNKSVPYFGNISRRSQDKDMDGLSEKREMATSSETGEGVNEMTDKVSGGAEKDICYQKQRSITLGSVKDFNFDNRNGSISNKPNVASEWWAGEKVAGKDAKASESWSFFPMLQPEVS